MSHPWAHSDPIDGEDMDDEDRRCNEQYEDTARRARWHRNSPTTYVLKARACDGGAVLATIEWRSERFYVWTLAAGLPIVSGGWKDSRHAAMRVVRRVLREGEV
jgi:hypothetical protein